MAKTQGQREPSCDSEKPPRRAEETAALGQDAATRKRKAPQARPRHEDARPRQAARPVKKRARDAAKGRSQPPPPKAASREAEERGADRDRAGPPSTERRVLDDSRSRRRRRRSTWTATDRPPAPDAPRWPRTARDHASMTPAITGGDVDVDVEDAYFSGDEAPGGDNPTPDQDIVDDIGKALGVEYQDNEELRASDKVAERDKHRWELDPASSEDYRDRKKVRKLRKSGSQEVQELRKLRHCVRRPCAMHFLDDLVDRLPGRVDDARRRRRRRAARRRGSDRCGRAR